MQNLPKSKNEQKFLSIQEAAKYLDLSPKTLRRWDISGHLPTVRTSGGHRRYRLQDLKNFKRNGYQKPLFNNTHNINNPSQPRFILEPQQKIALTIMSLILAVTFGAFAFVKAPSWNKATKKVISDYIESYANTLAQDYFKYHSSNGNFLLSGLTGAHNFAERNTEDFVLAASTTTDVPTFNVNVVSNFYDVAHFFKGLTGASVDAGTLNATGSATFATTTTNGNATFLANVDIKGDLTSPSTTFNLLNKGVTTLNIGGAATNISIGATSGTTTINSSSLLGTGIITGKSDLSIAGATTLSGKATLGSDLSVGGATTLTGNLTAGGSANDIAGTLNLPGNTLTSSGNLTITPASGSVILTGPDVLNIGGSGATALYNIISTTAPTLVQPTITGTDDLYNCGIFQVGGKIYGAISSAFIGTGLTQGSVVFIDQGGNLGQNNANFFWNNAQLNSSHGLGLGTNNPGTNALKVVGSTNLEGTTVFGTSSSDTITLNGTWHPTHNIIPQVDLSVDLGSNAKKFNNLYVGTVHANGPLSISGQAVFTYSPLDTTYGQSSVEINVTAPPADSYLLGTGINGAQRAGIDAEGDLKLSYAGGAGTSIPVDTNTLTAYNQSTTKIFNVDTTGEINTSTSPTTNGLVAYYRFDEPSWNGTTNEITDSSGNGNNGTATCQSNIGCNVPTTSSGKYGNAATFQNSTTVNQYANILHQLVSNTFTYSYSLWVKAIGTQSTNPVMIMEQGRAGPENNDSYMVQYSSGSIKATSGCAAAAQSVQNITNWTHVAVTHDPNSNQILLYINGVQVASGTTDSPCLGQALANQFKIGDDSYNPRFEGFNGQVDDVRIYNRVLTPAEVQGLYNYNYSFIAGQSAGNTTLTGGQLTLIGNNAGNALTTGGPNSFLGYQAGQLITTGIQNVIAGSQAGNNTDTGVSNDVILGYQSGQNDIAGYNVFAGYQSGKVNTVGGSTFIGYQTGLAQTSPNSSSPATTSGLVANWGLQDSLSTQSYSAVVNPAIATGRNLVVDGTFTSDPGPWVKGTGWTINTGTNTAHSDGTGVSANINNPVPIIAGKVYTVTYTVSNYVSGTVRALVGNTGTGTNRSANGRYTENIVASGNTNFSLSTNTSFVGDISNVILTQPNVVASSASPNNLLADGNMETAGVASWTAGNSATLTKQTTNPHGGAQLLRITRNGVSSPYAGQTILTVGNVYRVSGWMRSDGSATPIVYNGATTLFTGTTDTQWHSFDYLFVATATDIRFGSNTNTGTQYVEFDDTTVSTDTYVRSDNVITDGNMEASGTGAWTGFNSPTLTKQTTNPHGGTQVLRVALTSGSVVVSAYENILVTGKTYRVTGFARSDGNATPDVIDGAGSNKWVGTTSTSWQPFDVTFIEGTGVATNAVLFAANGTPGSGNYTEWDDISVTEVDPLSGLPTNSPTFPTAANGHLANAYSFNGTNNNVNIYSSDLNSSFNQSEGTAILWAKVSAAGVWTDATNRDLINIRVDGNNFITLQKTGTNNQLSLQYSAGGTLKSVSDTSLAGSTNWFQVVLTWSKSNDQVKAYINGAQVGSTQTALGTWVGNLSSSLAVIGASQTSGTLPWSGLINDVSVYNRALSSTEIKSLYNGNSGNTLVGYQTGKALTTGSDDTFFGNSAGLLLTTGAQNTIVGSQAGNATSTGLTGDVTIGYQAGKVDTAGSNTFIGYQAGFRSSTATGITEIGYQAGFRTVASNTTGNNNTLLGANVVSAGAATTFADNVILGSSAGNNLTTGTHNVVIGSVTAANALTTGSNSVFIGYESSLTGNESNSTFVGALAGEVSASGVQNTFIGNNAAQNANNATRSTYLGNAAGNLLGGADDLAIGANAGGSGGPVGTAAQNVFIGRLAGSTTGGTSATGNTFIGDQAGKVASASNDTFIGYQAGLVHTSGVQNTFIGYNSGQAVVGAVNNETFLGYNSGTAVTTGADNTLLGNSSGASVVTGIQNVFLGSLAGSSGSSVVNGDTFIGYNSGNVDFSAGNNTFIGNGAGQVASTGLNTFVGYQSGLNYTTGNYDPSSLVTSGLVGYWKLDEGSGTTANDSSGNGNTGTWAGTGSPHYVTGRFNTAGNFNPGAVTTDSVTIPDSPSLDVTSAITLSAWVNPSAFSSGNERIISKSTATSYALDFSSTAGTVRPQIRIGASTVTCTALNPSGGGSYITPLNKWTFITTTYDGANILVYINGVLANTCPASGAIGTDANSVLIGNSGGGIFHGLIDDARIYNRAITASEVNQLYDIGNTFLGYQSGLADTTGTGNSFLGSSAGASNTTGNQNTYIGSQSAAAGGTGVTGSTFIGYNTGNVNTGNNNSFIGWGAGALNTSGTQNSFVGYQAGNANTTSSNNTYMGYQSGVLATGADNTFLGNQTGLLVTNGAQNVLLGSQAGNNTSAGITGETSIGYQAGQNDSAGSNSFIGYQAGNANTVGAQNTFVGYQTGVNYNSQPSGLVAWYPLDDGVATQSFSRVFNPAVATGRNIVINGTFDTDTTWTDGSCTISGGVGVFTALSNGSICFSQVLPVTSGKAYTVTYTISGYSAGGVRIRSNNSVTGTTNSANGTYTQTLIADSGTTWRFETIGASTTLNIDNVTFQQVNVPSSTATATNLLTDGDMETAGVAAWTAGNSATLTKQTTNPHGGTQLLRVARNGSNNPYASQTILTIGNVYRVTGWMRSDGNTTPTILNGTTSLFSQLPATDTQWHTFDTVFVAIATDIRLEALTSTGTQYAEFDDVTVSTDTYIRSDGNIATDGNMEAQGVGAFTSQANAILTKQTTNPHGGSQVLRVAYNGSALPFAGIKGIANGKTYRVTGYARSDGSSIPQVFCSGGFGGGIFIGTTSTSWQPFDAICVANTQLDIDLAMTNVGTTYVEYDDVTVTEVDPLSGKPTNSPTFPTAASGHLANAYSFNGTNNLVNLYTTDFNSSFNPSEGTIIAWAKVSGAGVWTDGINRGILNLQVDANNIIVIRKSSVNNSLQMFYEAGGTSQNIASTAVGGSTNWFQVALTWSSSNNQVIAYVNGAQTGSVQNGLGTWTGNLSSSLTILGAESTAALHPWSGLINDVGIYNRALSATEINAQYNSGSNTLMGYQSGLALTTGNNNTFLGNQTGSLITTGQQNVILGSLAGNGTSVDLTGDTIVGYQAAQADTTGQGTFIGYQAGKVTTQGIQNTYIGYQAGVAFTAGDHNTGSGTLSGLVANWGLQDSLSTQSYAAVVNPAVAAGRNMVLNSTPTSSTSWTLNGNWSFGSNLFTHASGATGVVIQVLPISTGKAYTITYTVSGMTTGTVTVSLGASGTARSANGTYTETIVSTGTSLTFTPTSTFDGSISNFSVTQPNVPASNASPTQLLTDGNMETAGVAAWTAGNSAVLSKQNTSPRTGTQNLRVTANVTASAYAGQTILTVGNVYRLQGWMRSDGNAIPAVFNGGTTLFSGTTTNTTQWQGFDTVFVATATDIRLGGGVTLSGTRFVEFDDVTVSTDTYVRPDEVTTDGNMENSGTTAWTAVQSATLTKDTSAPHGGLRALQVAYGGAIQPSASENIMVLGKTYHFTGWIKGDGTVNPKVSINNGSVLFTGTNSTSWQSFDVTHIADGTTLLLVANTSSAGFAEFDDISVTEVDPLSGAPNGVSFPTASGGHLTNAYSFNGTNNNVSIYSSDLNSAFNPSEGTMIAWAKVSGAGVWTDSSNRYILNVGADGNNIVQILKSSSANTLSADYTAGNTTKTVTFSTSTTNWFQIVLTWSKTSDQVKLYVNGVQVGSTQTGLGTWAGNLAANTTIIGAASASFSSPWSGLINDVSVYNRALSASEISSLYYPGNTFMGYQAGVADTTGTGNVFLGRGTGLLVTTGDQNVILGSSAGNATSTGLTGDVIAGYQAGPHDTAGNNIFIGSNAGFHNTSGAQNTFIGLQAGNTNSTTSDNTYLGYLSGNAATGADNTFVGNNTGSSETTGNQNVFIGSRAGQSVNNAVSGDTFIGFLAGSSFSLGAGPSNSTFIGKQAGSSTTGTQNTYVGSGNSNGGTNNTGNPAALTSGSDNTVFGFSAAPSMTTGNQSVIIGSIAGGAASTTANVNIGYAAGQQSNSANNTAIGWFAGQTIGGGNNTSVGAQAGQGPSFNTSTNGTYLGYIAGQHVTTSGNDNTLLGNSSGNPITTGNQNLMIGSLTGAGGGAFAANNTFIGYNTGNVQTLAGNTFVGSGVGHLATAGVSTFIGYQAGNAFTNNLGTTVFDPSNVVTSGLVGYWKMDEASWNGTAGEVTDSSTGGNSGTAGGVTDVATTTATSRFGRAGNFEGTDDFVKVNNSVNLDIGTYSESLWFKTSTDSEYITNWNGATIEKYTLFVGVRAAHGTAHKLTSEVFSTGGTHYTDVTSAASVDDGNWHHAVTVMTGTQLSLYLDGKLVAGPTTTQAGVITGETDALFFGDGGNGVNASLGFYNGQIDDVRIYNRTLSADEVATLYDIGSTFLGYQAGAAVTNAAANTFLGNSAGALITTGAQNLFIGSLAGSASGTGVTGSTFIGYNAGNINTANNNTFIGSSAGSLNTSGAQNTFVGYQAGLSNTGSNGTFFGFQAGCENTTGNDNTFLGNQSAWQNSLCNANFTGNRNVFLGSQTKHTGNNPDSNNNGVSVGYQATNVMINAGDYVAIGTQALTSSAGLRAVAIGYQAAKSNGSTGEDGIVYLGSQTGLNSNGAIGAGLVEQTLVGYQAGTALTGGYQNTVLGYLAGSTMTSATWNTFVGYQAGKTTNTGAGTFIGYNAGNAITTANSANIPTITTSGLIASWPLQESLSTQSDALVTNPTLLTGRNTVQNSTPTSSTSWTLNANWAFGSNVFTHTTGSTATVTQSQSGGVTSGKAYTITYTVSGMTAGTITVSLGASGTARSTNGTFTETLISSSTTLTFTPSSTFDGSISAFSVTERNIPASTGGNTQLLADGNMETSGTSSWTAGNSATLSKVTGTRIGGSGVQLLRVARNGSNTPYAKQNILSAGFVYRVQGWARSDGNANPKIFTNSAGTTLFTGNHNDATTWQPFDFIFVGSAGDIDFGNDSTTGTQFTDFDDVTVSIDNYVRPDQVLPDADMEQSGTSYWTSFNAGVISKQTTNPHGGAQVIRVTYGGTTNPAATSETSILVAGKTYHVTGYYRSDGTAIPRLNNSNFTFVNGTTSTSWQYFDFTFTAVSDTSIKLTAATSTTSTYAEFDDININEVSPMAGTNTNVTPGTAANGHLTNAYSFNGTSSNVGITSSALNGEFVPNSGTLIGWAKVANAGVWTDGNIRVIAQLNADSNNFIQISKTGGSNNLSFQFKGGGTLSVVNDTSLAGTTNWFQVALVWTSGNQMVAYINGAQVGSTQSGLGTLSGNITGGLIGAGGGSFEVWSGLLNDVQVYNTSLAAGQIQALYNGNSNDTLMGYQAGNALTTGGDNTLLGNNAGLLITTGAQDTILGSLAGNNTGTGVTDDVTIGYQAGQADTAGSQTFVGYQAGKSVTSGVGNTVVGYQAGAGNAGNYNRNTFVGAQAGFDASGGPTGADNVLLGSMNDNQGITYTRSVLIQNGAHASTTDAIAIGVGTGQLNGVGSTYIGKGAFNGGGGTHMTGLGSAVGNIATSNANGSYIGVSAGGYFAQPAFPVGDATLIGGSAGLFSGQRSVELGTLAGGGQGSAANDVIIGQAAGQIDDAGNNTFIGFNSGNVTASGLLAYWKMDDAQWNGSLNEVTDFGASRRSFGQANGDTGTTTGSNTTTQLNDTGKSFPVNGLTNDTITITSGALNGQVRTISSNTATQVTVSVAWASAPLTGVTYRITPSTVAGGQFGRAGSFDGYKSFVSAPDGLAYNYERNVPWSLSLWAKETGTTISVLASKIQTSGNLAGWELLANDQNGSNVSGYLTFRLISVSPSNMIEVYTNSATNINNGSFHNYVVTYSGNSNASGVTIYEDGVSLALTTKTNTLTTTAVNAISITMGARTDNSAPYAGLLDDVRIYKRVLSSSEVTSIFNNTLQMGEQNTFLGYQTGKVNTNGRDNTMLGFDSGLAATTGADNTLLGNQTGAAITTGGTNTIIGSWTTTGSLTTGGGNVFIGYQAGQADSNSNELYIANTNTSTPLIYGNFTTKQIGLGLNNPDAKLQLKGAITGKALAIFSETGDQALFTASAGATPKFTIQHNGLTDASANGAATKPNAGVISDATFGSDTPVNGLTGVDSTDFRFYYRYGGAWHYTAQTAGFQIPNYEAFSYNTANKSFDTTSPLTPGDFLLPFVEKSLSDGGLHGLYAKFSDVRDELTSQIHTNSIRPLAGMSDITFDLSDSTDSATPTTPAQIDVKGSGGKTVASIDVLGNATVAATLKTTDLNVSNNATVSGELHAGKIFTTDLVSSDGVSIDDIQHLLTQVESNQNTLLSASKSWDISTASPSGTAEIDTQNLFVTNDAGINSLNIISSMLIGNNLAISPKDNSINSMTTALKLQSLASAPIEAMAGKFVIDTNGNVTINGDLDVTGKVTAPEATFKSVSSKKVTVSSSSAGKVVIPSGVSEITINNPDVNANTLIYLTATSATKEQIFIKSQGDGFFTAGFSAPVTADTAFNWWIVKTGGITYANP